MQKFHAAKFRTVKFLVGETLPRRYLPAAKILAVKIPLSGYERLLECVIHHVVRAESGVGNAI